MLHVRLFVFRIRAKRPGKVHSDEHAVQIQGEPQVCAAQRGGEDPQDSRDQVRQSRYAVFCSLPPDAAHIALII